VKVQKLEGTDGFVVVDLDAATCSVGVVRLAPKVLRDGAELLARSVTYSFATFGIAGHGGASAGINSAPDARDGAVASFVDELRSEVEAGRLRFTPGNGMKPEDLAPLGSPPLDGSSVVAGAITAADVVLRGLSGVRVALEGSGPLVDATKVAVEARGASVVDGGAEADCDALLVAGKAGVIDHEVAPKIKARTVVPLTAVPVTARAFAILRAADVIVVPDFISTAAPLVEAAAQSTGDPVERVRRIVGELASEGPAMWLAAVGLAEAFLATWQDEQPFGRPLA
jgi:glutamate dehydrogenase/leucine dehydrogenase